MSIRFYVNLISFFELTCISMRISSIINLSDTISMAILCSCYMLDFLFYHVIGKGSIVWKQGVVLLIFLFEDGRDGRTGNTSKQQKMVVFSEELLSENQFEGVLAIFCCSDYGVNVSKTVERIDTSNRFINAFCAL